MSVFFPINVDVAVELANLLDKSSEHKEQEGAHAALLGQNNHAALFGALVKQLPKFFGQGLNEAEAAVTLALATAAALEPAAAEPLLLQLSEGLSQQLFEGQNRRLLQLRLLGIIFNLVQAESSRRAVVLDHLLSFVQLAGLQRAVLDQFGQLAQWFKQWNLPPVECSQLYGRVADIHCSLSSHKHLGAQFRYMQLQALNGAARDALAERRPLAESIVISSINDPSVYQLDRLLDLDIVNDLAIDETYGKTYDLLKILVEAEDTQRFLDFQNSKADYFARTQLKPNLVLSKLRSLILCSIAERTKRIEFDVIQRRLGLQDSLQVEGAVIDAIRAGAIQAKIDEENGCVRVSAALRRKCSPELWENVNHKLSAWKDSVRRVLISLHEAQAAEDDLIDEEDLGAGGPDYLMDQLEDDEENEDVDDDDYMLGRQREVPALDDDLDEEM